MMTGKRRKKFKSFSQVVFISLAFLTAFQLHAQKTPAIIQSIEEKGTGEGTINITQDKRMETLLADHLNDLQRKPIRGYRIRISSNSGTYAKQKAENARAAFLAAYPYEDFRVNTYLVWDLPNFKVYVGDFRTESEALRFKKFIARRFPYAFIVHERINFPVLEEKDESDIKYKDDNQD